MTATLTKEQRVIHEGLRKAASLDNGIRRFRWYFQGNEVLEGLLSKDYVEVNEDRVEITVKGARALLDFEGIPEP